MCSAITVSLVLFHTPKTQVERILKSVLDSSGVSRFYIIDNSPDDRFRILEERSSIIRYIHNANLGYGAAHNIAIQEAIEENSTYHLVVNPDVYFAPNVLPALAAYMDEHPDVVYMLPKVLYPDGELQYLCKLLPAPSDLIFRRFLPERFSRRRNNRYTLKASGYDSMMNPPCLSGCFMFMRTETLRKYSLFFDERFFMYCEDFDLMRRLHRVGKTLYYPAVSVIHDHARESYKSKKMLIEHIKSAVKYFNKYGWVFDSERSKMNRQILDEVAAGLSAYCKKRG
ncbi:MAG: glycosyltransferase family 2 protein [Spirochaetes bacterium]|uniref:Glycosyltransferase family 2 protein n=1 Tax=Candidatus Avitreponema avistercoris TaxID=2840705 RepID=A0A9D9END8_9SPIR|nr:glycosyltransferase family 2 protein [Candidatus Avitreponema avistercoris]